MGNQLSSASPSMATAGIDSYVSELGDIQYEKSLGSARFMKTIRGRHRDGPVVVKIFIKPAQGVSLTSTVRRLQAERDALLEIPNAFGYQKIIETEKAGYLVRQYLFSSLYDRISTRPFLDLIEKKWITYQMLCGVAACHSRGIYHGDIKAENFLVTSWNWVYLADFASFKPTNLPEDNPADFSFFFDTSSRRTCYVAPERFSGAVKKTTISTDAEQVAVAKPKLNAAMDIFSLGCVIAELFLEGTAIFNLSQLFQYRAGAYDPTTYLAKIEDAAIRSMVSDMISLDPSKRKSAEHYLTKARGTAFPDYFYTFLQQYISTITDPQNRTPAANALDTTASPSGKADADDKIERLYCDFDKIAFFLGFFDRAANEAAVEDDSDPSSTAEPLSLFPIRLQIPNYSSPNFAKPRKIISSSDDGALIILTFLCAHIRNAIHPSSKIYAIDMLLAIGEYLTDEVKLDRLSPYLIALLGDDVASVRAAALKALTQLLMIIKVITPSNATLFPEYILVNTRPFTQDPEVSIRTLYAQCITPLAETALRFLEMRQALKVDGSFDATDADSEADTYLYEASYDACLQDLQAIVQEQVTTLLIDSESSVKRAILSDITSLCIFFGRQRANDVLLSHMITYLNDKDWMLRSAFFESIVGVGTFVGGRSLEEYILPLMVQALADPEEFVVEKVLNSLTSLAELGLFQKMQIWELSSIVVGFVCHPNTWIRYSAIGFLSTAARLLPKVDKWCTLYPIIRPFLKNDISDISTATLLEHAEGPLSKAIMDGALVWASKAERSSFWKPAKERGGRLDIGKQPFNPNESIAKSEEDKQWLEKLRLLRMSPQDELKIAALRDYLYKTAVSQANLRREDPDKKPLYEDELVPLKDLNITPQNIFFNELAPETSQRLLTDAMDGITHKHDQHFIARRGSQSSASTATRVEAVNHRNLRRDDNAKEDLDELTRTISARPNLEAPRSPSLQGTAPGPLTPTKHQAQSPLSQDSFRPPSPTDSVSSMSTLTGIMRPQGLRSRSGAKNLDFEKAAPALSMSSATVQGMMNINSSMENIGPNRSPSVRAPSMQHEPAKPTHSITSYVSSTYDGNDPHIQELLENVYMDAFPQLEPQYGPKVQLSSRRRVIKANTGSRVSSYGWRPQGTLIAHLNEHRAAINQIAVAPDHAFFATCSDDGTVKIWDTTRLEKNVTNRSRVTYSQQSAAKVKCMSFISGTHSIASAADDGSIHVFRVDYTPNGAAPKYSKSQTILRHQLTDESAVALEHVMMDSVSTLFFATTKGRVVGLNMSAMEESMVMQNPVQFGPITAMCIDRRQAWLLIGTSRGMMSLFDLRFGLRLKSWSIGDGVSISKLTIHPSKGRGRQVVVTCSKPEIQVWDLESATCHETFRASSPARHTRGQSLDGAMSKHGVYEDMSEELDRMMKDGFAPDNKGESSFIMTACFVGMDVLGADGRPARDEGVQGQPEQEGKGGGFMLVGGSDRKLRFWDLAKIEASLMISGLDLEEAKPTYSQQGSVNVETSAVSGKSNATPTPKRKTARLNRSTVIAQQQQHLLKNHLDAIADIAVLAWPYGMVVSADKSGVIKVYE